MFIVDAGQQYVTHYAYLSLCEGMLLRQDSSHKGRQAQLSMCLSVSYQHLMFTGSHRYPVHWYVTKGLLLRLGCDS